LGMNLTARKSSRTSVFNLLIEASEAINGFAKAPE
jgi:hypothetical protein